MAAAYPLRRTLYRETWNLGAYLLFFGRLIVAAYGLWILIAFTPILAGFAGTRDLIVAGALTLVVLAWYTRSSTIFCALVGSRPVDEEVLVSRFGRMLEDAGLPAVALEQVDLRGGVFANAVALPSIRRPTVVISSTLIERLDRDETTAVLAHELAHIEHYNHKRLWKRHLVAYPLMIVTMLWSPGLRFAAPGALAATPILWPVMLVVLLMLQARHRQKHETESDLRAVALTGNADALVRALTKLHAFARLPRRWDTDFERRATHPSLARRIQAIHAAAGIAPVSLDEPVTFAGTDGASSVTFQTEQLLWHDRHSSSRTLAYAQLTELRVAAHRSRAPQLVAVDFERKRWQFDLSPGDVGRAQGVLDVVDTRLGRAAPPPPVSQAVGRIIAATIILCTALAGQYSVVLAGGLAVARPASPLAAAVGVAAIGAVALTWRDHGLRGSGGADPWLMGSSLLCGLISIGMALTNRQEPVRGATARLVGVLAVCAALAWGCLLASGMGAFDLYGGSRDWPAATILALALAGALALHASRPVRYASVPLALAGLLAGFLGSTSFLDRFVHDPFLAPAGPVTIRTIDADADAGFRVPFTVTELWLSPTAQHVAIGSEEQDEHPTIRAGRTDGQLKLFTADEAIFVDETRLLLLERERDASVLRVVDLETGGDAWSRRVPLASVQLSFVRSSRQWRLLGWKEDGDIASVEGRVGDDAARETRWKPPESDEDNVQPLSVSASGDLLAFETRYLSRLGGALGQWSRLFRPLIRTDVRFWTVNERGQSAFAASRLSLSCFGSPDDEPATCTAFDGRRTRFITIDPGTRQLTALASLDERFIFRGASGGGWVSGWMDNRWADGGPLVLNARTRQGIRVAGRRPYKLTVSGKTLAAVSWTDSGSFVRLYLIE
jgi:Zn-dependent protease with chaperone function